MKKLMYLSLAVLLLAGCVKENVQESDASCGKVFKTSFEKSDTKVYVDGNLETRWTADDRISIFMTTYNAQYRFNGKTGDDSGDFSEVSSSFNTGNGIPTNYAVYPYSSETSITTSGTISLKLPAVQSYAENSYGLGANTMVAVTESSSARSLQFKNLCGFLEVKLYGEGTVNTISLKGNNGEKIAGSATVTPVYGQAPEVSVSGSGSEEITIDCGSGVTLGKIAETATSFWFVIPPLTFSKGFTVTATNTEGWSMVKTTSSSRTVQRNVKTSMPALEAKFDTKSGFVYFEDANFKAYCVENFDANKDGEISYDEAAVVKEIRCSISNISSLVGIEYFTALTSLSCGWNQLTSLDVSKNTALNSLICDYNQLTSLDVSKNTALTSLYCYSNQLTSLDVSSNTALISLNCGSNQLTSLDVSKNADLRNMYCSENQLTSLDVSNNSNLQHLSCTGNPSLSEIWLKQGQTITMFEYDSAISTIKYKSDASD